jgi:hypothetical protein
MKNKILYISLLLLLLLSACNDDKFGEYYVDPKTINESTIEKQFAGALSSTFAWTMYQYYNYFVVLQNTALHYTQVVGWQNFEKQYEPGAAGVGERWGQYYGYLAQHNEFLKVYYAAPESEQQEKKIYLILANIFFYDQTQQMVDIWGDIPWSQAGMLSTNNGDYKTSYAKYDDAASIYTKMLDDLKTYADELNSISVPAPVAGVLKTQDFINHADMTLWKKYCNSLRVRMLMRVSKVAGFQSRVTSELAAIAGNATAYPVCSTSTDNIKIDSNQGTGVTSDLYNGIIGWGTNDTGNKGMIDMMNSTADPRLRAMFQPRNLPTSGRTDYIGLDPMLSPSEQDVFLQVDSLSRYNFSTISKNKNLPGLVMSSASTQFMMADYYLNIANDDGAAKAAYENGIKISIDYYHWLRSISDNNEIAVAAVTDAEKMAYLASSIAWAGTKTEKNVLIAKQKWINYSILQPLEGWAEVRRTNLPAFSFRADNSSQITTLPPTRWFYPDNERIYNTENYSMVQGNDKVTNKVFWDVD